MAQTVSRLFMASKQKTVALFPAAANRNYQLYFGGQLVSMIGTWLQIVAEGWLVLKLTNSPFLVGLITALATLPTLLFSLFGGVIGDRFHKKNILIFTQIGAMILALAYGILTVSGLITIWEIGVLAFLLGTLTAIDLPARQAFLSEMVERPQMASAIALNSAVFNGARVIGPGFAGVLIASIGIGGAFILNGLTYIASLLALVFMKVESTVPETHPNPITAIKEGIAYSAKHPIIKVLLVYTGILSIFGFSFTTILPVIAKQTFHLDAAGLGSFFVATGLGAVTSTILISFLSKRVSHMGYILGGNTLFSIAIALFSLTNNIHFAWILLFISGVGLLSVFTTMNTTIQHLVADRVRGRVMSIYTIMFMGLAPFGSLQIGWVSEQIGTGKAILIGAVITFFSGLFLFSIRKRVSKEYIQYKEDNPADHTH